MKARIAVLLALAACAVAPVEAPPASGRDDFMPLVRFMSGVWRVTYDGGAVRTYIFKPNGTVEFVEEQRRCTMCVSPEILLAFNDGKIERVSVMGDVIGIEHWNPGANYPSGVPLRGTGKRVSR